MFKYRIRTVDGDEVGEAMYAVGIQAGEIVHFGAGTLRVVDVLPESRVSAYQGALMVELASRRERRAD